MVDLYLSIPAQEVITNLNQVIVDGSVTGTLVHQYTTESGNGPVTVLIYEKHSFLAENRLTLTVILDTVDGKSHLHAISAGGGKGIFRVDYGASGRFEDCIYDAVFKYIL